MFIHFLFVFAFLSVLQFMRRCRLSENPANTVGVIEAGELLGSNGIREREVERGSTNVSVMIHVVPCSSDRSMLEQLVMRMW